MATITSLLATIPQEIVYAHILPYYSRTWLYVSKRCHKIAFKQLLQDPRIDGHIKKISWGLLHKAIIHDSISGVRLLLQDPRVDVNWFAINQVALKRGNYQILKMLANCSRLLSHIFIKLIWWAAEHHHFKLVVDLLHDARADPTSGVLSETVLTAIRVHDFSIVQYIVTKFEYNDTLSEIADQALLLAVENDDYSIVKLLVEHGCDPSGINNEILRKAVQKKNYEIVEYLLLFPDVDPMDDRPFYINNPSIEDPMGSAIGEAISSRDIILIEMLVQHPKVQLTDEMQQQLEYLI